jgi:hypothetical protein
MKLLQEGCKFLLDAFQFVSKNRFNKGLMAENRILRHNEVKTKRRLQCEHDPEY